MLHIDQKISSSQYVAQTVKVNIKPNLISENHFFSDPLWLLSSCIFQFM